MPTARTVMNKELLNITLKAIHTMEFYSSGSLDWRQTNDQSTMYNLALPSHNALKQEFFKLRKEYLGTDAGNKTLTLKDSLTLQEIFTYLTKK